MKVKDLKKKLDKLSDDMDVKILLPEVEDWADVRTEKISLKRMKKEEALGFAIWKNKQLNEEHNLGRREDLTIDDMKEQEWEIHAEYMEDEVKDMYDFREAFLLRPKARGKITFDRHGDIKY